VAEADATGKVRGFVEGSLQKPWMGTLTVVKELRLGTPYTSIVPIVSNELKDNLLYYFEKSEQVKTALDISVDFDQEGVIKTASGYLVQILGGAEETSVSFVEEIIKRTINMQARPEDMAYSILEGKEPRLIGLKEVEYYCPCNEEIARSTLFLLEEEELEEIFSEGPAEVVCKFCGRVYRFTKDML
jgi:molecular chaperone Hsp33